jgi:hypothetical protein
MYQENTGRSILDSGDAYGRNWERNQGVPIDFFLNHTGSVDCEYQTVTISGFLTVLNHLEHDEVSENLTKDFREWVEAQPIDDAYFNSSLSVEEWLESLGLNVNQAWNSYNWDTLIDSVFQGVEFELNDRKYVALSYHGGADVRGGYTDFVIFRCDCECFAYSMASASLYCQDCGNYATVSPGYIQWDDGEPDSDTGSIKNGCPKCESKKLEVQLDFCWE